MVAACRLTQKPLRIFGKWGRGCGALLRALYTETNSKNANTDLHEAEKGIGKDPQILNNTEAGIIF